MSSSPGDARSPRTSRQKAARAAGGRTVGERSTLRGGREQQREQQLVCTPVPHTSHDPPGPLHEQGPAPALRCRRAPCSECPLTCRREAAPRRQQKQGGAARAHSAGHCGQEARRAARPKRPSSCCRRQPPHAKRPTTGPPRIKGGACLAAAQRDGARPDAGEEEDLTEGQPKSRNALVRTLAKTTRM